MNGIYQNLGFVHGALNQETQELAALRMMLAQSSVAAVKQTFNDYEGAFETRVEVSDLLIEVEAFEVGEPERFDLCRELMKALPTSVANTPNFIRIVYDFPHLKVDDNVPRLAVIITRPPIHTTK